MSIKSISIFFSAIGLILAVVIVLLLADFLTSRLAIPRQSVMWGYKHQGVLFWLSILFASLGFAIAIEKTGASILFQSTLLIAITMMSVFGRFGISRLMLRGQQRSTVFVSQLEASKHISDDHKVFVVEVNGDARAFPFDWMVQPHVAGSLIGGKDVAMTVCGLSHLGLAYEGKIENQKTDFKVLNQMDNNLIFFDGASSKMPIQQVTGKTDDASVSLTHVPTLLMPFRSFKKIYPDAKVQFNPPENLFDKLLSGVMLKVLKIQDSTEHPVVRMPNLPKDNLGIGWKEKVYALSLNNQQLAVTQDKIKNDTPLILEVGGQQVALVYYSEYDFVGAYFIEAGQSKADLISIDPYGRTANGKLLERTPLFSQVYWMIWLRYFPDTSLLKLGSIEH